MGLPAGITCGPLLPIPALATSALRLTGHRMAVLLALARLHSGALRLPIDSIQAAPTSEPHACASLRHDKSLTAY